MSFGLNRAEVIGRLGADVSRRTAERMRDAVEWAFGPLETVPAGDNRLHWRLRSRALHGLIRIMAEDLTALSTATEKLERAGLQEQAGRLRDRDTKLRALQQEETLERLESDLEILLQAEGLAMRPGPRQPIDPGLLSLLREAILTRRTGRFRYRARSTGQDSRQAVEPYGLLPDGDRALARLAAARLPRPAGLAAAQAAAARLRPAPLPHRIRRPARRRGPGAVPPARTDAARQRGRTACAAGRVAPERFCSRSRSGAFDPGAAIAIPRQPPTDRRTGSGRSSRPDRRTP